MRSIPAGAVATGLLFLIAGCGNIGGDTVVAGEGNTLVSDTTRDRLALALANLETTPEVTDAEIGTIYDNIRSGALEGNLEAAVVMLRLAEIQRSTEE